MTPIGRNARRLDAVVMLAPVPLILLAVIIALADGRAAGALDGRAAGASEGRAAGASDGRAAGASDGRAAGASDGHPRTRTRRGSDEWIPPVLNNICLWADCQGMLNCPPEENCPTEPNGFRVRKARTEGHKCFALRDGNEPATDACSNEGPKEDVCACITGTMELQIGYGPKAEAPKLSDEPIHLLCSRSFKRTKYTERTCPTSAPPTTRSPTTQMVRTTNEEREGVRTTTVTRPMSTSSRTSQATLGTTTGAADSTATVGITQGMVVQPEGEASIFIHIWLPALLGLVLFALLVALFRRRRKSHRRAVPSTRVKIPADRDDQVRYTSYGSPKSPGEKSCSSGASMLSNPSYERHISGNEMDRETDFFCPRMESVRNNRACAAAVAPAAASGASTGTGSRQAGDGDAEFGAPAHGNPRVLLGNHNAAFSEGNYLDVGLDAPPGGTDGPGEGTAPVPATDRPLEPGRAARAGPSRPEAGYDNPDGLVSPRSPCPTAQKPRKVSNGVATPCVRQGPPSVPTSSSPAEGALSTTGYEVAELAPRAKAASASDATASYIYEESAVGDRVAPARYAQVNKSQGAPTRERSPKADSDGYEVAAVSPGIPSAGSPSSPSYDYALPSGAYPPGKLVSVNKYNVLQTGCKEKDGEYSVLSRGKGGGGQAGHVSPLFVSVNEYNRIDLHK